MADPPMIYVNSLTHRFGERVAVDAVSFGVDRGTMFGLLGPNGGGKTTLFRILNTTLTPTQGRAVIDGADVVAERRRVRGSIGVVFQHPSLDGKLTVLENLTTQGRLYRLHGRALLHRCDELMERFDIADRAHERVKQLSGGLQRRVEIAKAMLHRPAVLILDEPSTGLDPSARGALVQHLHDLRDRDGVTCLLTTHLMDEADRCDRIAVLDRGKLVALDAPAALKGSVGGDVLTIVADEPRVLAARIKQRFALEPEQVDHLLRIERERGHEFVPELIEAFPGSIQSVTVGRPTLEDVFVKLTGRRL